MEGPEIHTPHRHAGGLPRWLELLIALTALVTSVSSIVIALHHGETMEKLVQANSIPYLEAGPSNATPDGLKRVSLDLMNRGVGPAHEHSLRIKVGGKYVRSVDELIAAVVGPQDAAAAQAALGVYRNSARDRFIPANTNQFVFQIDRTEANGPYWDKLSKSLDGWSIEHCYCSVFDECWQVTGEDRKPVKQCLRDEPNEFKP